MIFSINYSIRKTSIFESMVSAVLLFAVTFFIFNQSFNLNFIIDPFIYSSVIWSYYYLSKFKTIKYRAIWWVIIFFVFSFDYFYSISYSNEAILSIDLLCARLFLKMFRHPINHLSRKAWSIEWYIIFRFFLYNLLFNSNNIVDWLVGCTIYPFSTSFLLFLFLV